MPIDEMTGLWYPECTIKPKGLCICKIKHNSIEVSSNKCNNCNKKLENEI